jgi:hypothetical protein
MAIVRCPKCNLSLTASEAAAGNCPSCGGRLPAGAREAERPRPTAAKGPEPTFGERVGRAIRTQIGVVALLAAIGLGVLTYFEAALAMQSTRAPDEMKLKDLIARGPQGNAHVIVTDFVLCDNGVSQHLEKSSGSWVGVWIPLVPSDEVVRDKNGLVNATNVKVLFYRTSIHNKVELEDRRKKLFRLQGMVTNSIMSVPEGDARHLLLSSFPGTDFDKCLIIHEGRRPFDFFQVFLLGAGTLVALVVAVACFWPRSRTVEM